MASTAGEHPAVRVITRTVETNVFGQNRYHASGMWAGTKLASVESCHLPGVREFGFVDMAAQSAECFGE